MMLVCFCTHNAKCRLCRNVMELRLIAQNLGLDKRADKLRSIAESMELELKQNCVAERQAKAKARLNL